MNIDKFAKININKNRNNKNKNYNKNKNNIITLWKNQKIVNLPLFAFYLFLLSSCYTTTPLNTNSANTITCENENNPPTYTGQISTLLNTYCVNCHSPDNQHTAFSSYSGASGDATNISQRLLNSTMPPYTYSPVLSTADSNLIIQWIACGMHE